MCYYRAQLNAALNADNLEVPIKSWADVANSDFKIIVWHDTIPEKMLQKKFVNGVNIYDKVDPTVDLYKIGYKGSIPYLLSEKYIVFGDNEPYNNMEEFPCKIMPLNYQDFRYLHYFLISIHLSNEINCLSI